MGKISKTAGITTLGAVMLLVGVGTFWQSPEDANAVSCNATSIQASDSESNTINVPEEYREPIKKAAKVAGLPESIVAAQIQAESNFDKNAGSPAGAQGPAQFLPETFAQYSDGDIHDIDDALEAYGKYMVDLKKIVEPYTDGDPNRLVRLTLAAYNAGPGSVTKYKDVPPFSETKNYVEKITKGAQVKFSSGCRQITGAKAWDGDLGKGEWTNPLPNGHFTSGFGSRNVPGLPAWAQMHQGVDLATGSGYGPQGTVISPIDLRITGIYEKDGCVLGTMTAEPKFRMAFCHMDNYTVKEGDEIKRGTEMGRESNHAESVGTKVISHLHFEIHTPGNDYTGSNYNPYEGTAINPEPILKEKGAFPGQ